ncbi:MAG: DNA integrity scanning diadenylate cyclase DisA, partial [Bacillota bacterium]
MEDPHDEFKEVLEFLAPGTKFREGLENILRANTGGLIVVGDDEEVLGIVDGGFNINSELTSTRLYELAKMDGAIVLSSDCERILCANVQLVPDPSISSMETGTRHRAAERVAKQTGKLVISISQRRDIIS